MPQVGEEYIEGEGQFGVLGRTRGEDQEVPTGEGCQLQGMKKHGIVKKGVSMSVEKSCNSSISEGTSGWKREAPRAGSVNEGKNK